MKYISLAVLALLGYAVQQADGRMKTTYAAAQSETVTERDSYTRGYISLEPRTETRKNVKCPDNVKCHYVPEVYPIKYEKDTHDVRHRENKYSKESNRRNQQYVDEESEDEWEPKPRSKK